MHPVVPLLQLLQTLQRVDGRKKLQKTVHILKELGVPFSERFEYSYYGMYSPQLKAEVDNLESEGLLTESPQQWGSTTAYVIEATPDLSKLLEDVNLAQPPPWAGVAKQLNGLSAVVLEGVSTILYLRRTGTPEERLCGSLLSLKPHLQDVVSQCFAEADRLSAHRLSSAFTGNAI